MQEESRFVGALRKHAGGMFLASDLGGYAAVASILSLKVPSYVGGRTGSSAPTKREPYPVRLSRRATWGPPYGVFVVGDAGVGGWL